MNIVSFDGSGMRSRNCADCIGETRSRGAPFGVPVVPLVRITMPPGLPGALTFSRDCLPIRS